MNGIYIRNNNYLKGVRTFGGARRGRVTKGAFYVVHGAPGTTQTTEATATETLWIGQLACVML